MYHACRVVGLSEKYPCFLHLQTWKFETSGDISECQVLPVPVYRYRVNNAKFHKKQRVFSIWNYLKMSSSALSVSFEYLCYGSTGMLACVKKKHIWGRFLQFMFKDIWNITYVMNLRGTYLDFRFWRLNTIPALKGLKLKCPGRR